MCRRENPLAVIWLCSQGRKTAEVARQTGFNTDWNRRLIRLYNALGPISLGDRRKNNGNKPILGDEALEELQQALRG